MDNKADIVWRIFYVAVAFAALLFIFLVLAGTVKAQPQTRPCTSGGSPMGDVAAVIERLEEKFGETPRFMGIIPKNPRSNQAAFFMVFVDPKDGSWTMGYYKDPSQFCGMVSGQGGVLLEFEPSSEGA